MKKREMKKRIEDGFSELAPDIFETVWQAAGELELVCSSANAEQPAEQESTKNALVQKHLTQERTSFWFGKLFTERFPKYVLSMCACLAMICLCIFGIRRDEQDVVYMVLDINPSIQIEMNRENQVKRLKGLNQDGKDVVKELKWTKKEPVQELLDVLLQDVVEKSYLGENGGILVTLSAPDKDICEKLEHALGEGTDRKLTELKVSGVMTAFQQAKADHAKQGRKILEAELEQSYGMRQEEVEQMSVMELIQYCQDYTSVELKLSEVSAKERAAQVQQKKENNVPKKTDKLADEDDQKPKEQNSELHKSKEQKPADSSVNEELELPSEADEQPEEQQPLDEGESLSEEDEQPEEELPDEESLTQEAVPGEQPPSAGGVLSGEVINPGDGNSQTEIPREEIEGNKPGQESAEEEGAVQENEPNMGGDSEGSEEENTPTQMVTPGQASIEKDSIEDQDEKDEDKKDWDKSGYIE